MRWFTILFLIAALMPAFTYADQAPNSSQINTVAIIHVPEPTEIVVMGKGSLAMAFGAIGAAAVAVDAHTNQKGLLGAITRTKFSFADQLTQDLSAALAARGLKTLLVSADRKGRPDKLLEDYSAIQATGAEAILDVSMVALGYATEHFLFSPHWRPEAHVRVLLVSRVASQPLYEERIMYGLHNPLMSAAKLDAPKQYQFADQDAMDAADDATLIGGLQDASKAIAAHVAKNMPTSDIKNEKP